MWLSDLSVRRPVFSAMLIGALVALGWISLGRIGLDLFPRVEFPVITVTTVLEGAAPGTIESEVTEVLEEEISNLPALRELVSRSSQGLSQIFVWFQLEVDAGVAVQSVRDKVALARRELPADTELSIVERVDPDSLPILSVIVSGPRPVPELTRFAKNVVKERIQRLPGVGSVTLVGGREREIRIWLDAYALRAYRLTAEDVILAIQREHAEIPAGLLEAAGRTEEFSFKTRGEVESVRELGELAVAYRDGAPTRVRDVARVEDGLEDERTYAELNGVPGVSLEVRRQSGQNMVRVARAVREEVERLRGSTPPGIEIVVARDVSRFIESSVRDVGVDLVLGGILAVLVTFAFLRNLRSTLIVASAIPASVIATFFFFYIAGFTLNVISLMALSISIGLLIDDAIVVLEAIYRRIEAGEAPLRAAARGTAEVGQAVVAATLAIGAVFVPIAFMRGMVGRFFYEYGLTVTFAVGVSLLVAFTLTPSLSGRVLHAQPQRGQLSEWLERLYAQLEEAYRRLLGIALDHRLAVVAIALASVVGAAYLARMVPMSFDSDVDRSEFEATIELPLGTGIEQTKRVVHRASSAVLGHEHVTSVFATVGAGSQGRVNDAELYVKLTPKQQRSLDMLEIMEEVRGVLRRTAAEAKRTGASQISWVSGGGFTAFNLHYSVQGPDLARLELLSEQIALRMRQSRRFADTTVSYETGRPEVEVIVDRSRAADLGVPLRSLAMTLRALVGGLDVATYQEDGERYAVRVRLEEGQRDDLADLALVQLRTREGRLADLDTLASLRVTSGPAQIDREDRSRKVDVFANTPSGVALGTAVQELDAIVADVRLPEGYLGRHRGWAERMQDSAESVKFAFVVALLALYMILASQFNSLVQPAITMLTAPLAFIGAYAALALTGSYLTMFAQIALLALMGLVMKNGILLIDYANRLRPESESARDAMLRAGPVRLRPVLMTTLSTVFGMLPVAISRADGAEWRNPMGVLAVGGMLSSTLLTLVVVPVVYTLLDDARGIPGRIRRWRAPRRADILPATPPRGRDVSPRSRAAGSG